MNNSKDREKIAKEIAKTSNSQKIPRKMEENIALERHFKLSAR